MSASCPVRPALGCHPHCQRTPPTPLFNLPARSEVCIIASCFGMQYRDRSVISSNGGRSSVGRVQDCDSCCRGFEPRRSPQIPPHIKRLSPVDNLPFPNFPTFFGIFKLGTAPHSLSIAINHISGSIQETTGSGYGDQIGDRLKPINYRDLRRIIFSHFYYSV